ncbi:hypothetical protein [Mesorhizobium sp. ES1-1]|uniref:hypothetical protein n=1 Tax=Mesorhizobium sp. ES1-1 TaxID=2876629 RepID=UPI00398CA4B9
MTGIKALPAGGVLSIIASNGVPKGIAMSYRKIIVKLGIDADPAPIIKFGVDLANRFRARLTGVAAADVPRCSNSHDQSELMLWFPAHTDTVGCANGHLAG